MDGVSTDQVRWDRMGERGVKWEPRKIGPIGGLMKWTMTGAEGAEWGAEKDGAHWWCFVMKGPKRAN